MEKDVLVEAIAGLRALMSKKTDNEDPLFEADRVHFSVLLGKVRLANPDDLDADALIAEINTARSKYKAMPYSLSELALRQKYGNPIINNGIGAY
jgi:hypothetical protein